MIPELLLAAQLTTEKPEIRHEPIGCMLADRHSVIEATTSLPLDLVARASVYFRSDMSPGYFYVHMTRSGDSFSARLARPKLEANTVSYYIMMIARDGEELQGPEIETLVVSRASECPDGQRVAATAPGDRLCVYGAFPVKLVRSKSEQERCDMEHEQMQAAARRLGDLERLEVVRLRATLDHVQGIDVEGDSLWVSSVDRKAKRGFLHLFDLKSGRLRAEVSVERGSRYHPGGIALDGDSIWVPVAEYARASSALVQRRDKKTLALVSEFEVADHIGCLAAGGGTVLGGNWDSRIFYEWTPDGRLLRQRPNPTPNAYQDLKRVDGLIVASGNVGAEEGEVDWLDPETLALKRSLPAGKTDRGVRFTNEGMAIRDGKLYLLPEDGPSRLFVFRLR